MSSPFPTLDHLLESLHQAYQTRDAPLFARCLVCSPRADGVDLWDRLRGELLARETSSDPVKHLDTFVQHWKTTTPSIHPILPTFLTSWLSYLLTTTWSPVETSADKAEREWKAFDQTYAEANRIFTGPGGAEAVGVWGKGMKKMAENLMHLAFRSANLSRDKRFSKPSISIDRVRKTFSAAAFAECRMDESDLVPKRGDEAFALGNICWRVYDQLHAYRLLDTVIQTYGSMRPSALARLGAPCTSKAERVGYWYWLGKTSLAKGDVRRAREYLKRAFDTCPLQASKNLRAIFIRLLTCQILLGSFPSASLISHFRLEPQFGPLIQAIKTGDRAGYYRCFEKWSEWYRRRGVWLVLREKGEVLVWRSLFRNTYRIWSETNPLADPAAKSARCPTSIFLTAMRMSFAQCEGEEEAADVDATDVVSLLASLIDQSYIRGQLSYSQQYLVMRKSPGDPYAGFPKVASVRPRAVVAIA